MQHFNDDYMKFSMNNVHLKKKEKTFTKYLKELFVKKKMTHLMFADSGTDMKTDGITSLCFEKLVFSQLASFTIM